MANKTWRILGISPAVVRKHYAKWSQSRQDRITRVMQAVHAEAFGMERQTAKERVN
jgi:hypothetical protein